MSARNTSGQAELISTATMNECYEWSHCGHRHFKVQRPTNVQHFGFAQSIFLHTFHNFILVSYILIIGLSLHRSCLFLCRIYFFGIFSSHLHKVMHKLRFASNYEWSWIQLKYPVISLRTNLIDISLYLEFPKSFFFCSLYGPVVAQV